MSIWGTFWGNLFALSLSSAIQPPHQETMLKLTAVTHPESFQNSTEVAEIYIHFISKAWPEILWSPPHHLAILTSTGPSTLLCFFFFFPKRALLNSTQYRFYITLRYINLFIIIYLQWQHAGTIDSGMIRYIFFSDECWCVFHRTPECSVCFGSQ